LPDGLLIQTDSESTHGAVVKLMDDARNAGVTNISVSEL
jgi:biopolymer transport protein ExbD